MLPIASAKDMDSSSNLPLQMFTKRHSSGNLLFTKGHLLFIKGHFSSNLLFLLFTKGELLIKRFDYLP